MIVLKKYQYCGLCGKKLDIVDNGVKQTEFDRMTGKPLYAHEYILRCGDYRMQVGDEFEFETEKHDVFIYHDPIEDPQREGLS